MLQVYWLIYQTCDNVAFWLSVLFVVVACLLPAYAFHALQWLFAPSMAQVVLNAGWHCHVMMVLNVTVIS